MEQEQSRPGRKWTIRVVAATAAVMLRLSRFESPAKPLAGPNLFQHMLLHCARKSGEGGIRTLGIR